MSKTGNTRLIRYGIQTEGSDYRIHIGVLSRTAYVFPTSSGVVAIRGKQRIKEVKTKGIITATGVAVAIGHIADLQTVPIPSEVFSQWPIKIIDTTSKKGTHAVYIARELIKVHKIKLPLSVDEITEKNLQILGTDLLVTARMKIQVKCDFRAGPHRVFGCTGNLFLQLSECNPFNNY